MQEQLEAAANEKQTLNQQMSEIHGKLVDLKMDNKTSPKDSPKDVDSTEQAARNDNGIC
jgi:hypothetical protein